MGHLTCSNKFVILKDEINCAFLSKLNSIALTFKSYNPLLGSGGHVNFLNSVLRDAFVSSDEVSEVLTTASMGGGLHRVVHTSNDGRICYTM